MAETALTAQPRTATGSRACRQLRAQGLTPGVVYGHKEDVVAIQVADDDIERMIREKHKIVDLDLNGAHEKVVIRELAWDTYSKHVLHVDFVRVSKGELIEVELPIQFTGDAIGVGNGGVLEHPHMSLNIECPALQLPDAITVDLSDLKIGETITVADIKVPDQVRVLDEPDTPLATIIDPAAMEAAADAEAEASAGEPEVIGEAPAAGEDDADTAVVN